jgi:hypothetical protein
MAYAKRPTRPDPLDRDEITAMILALRAGQRHLTHQERVDLEAIAGRVEEGERDCDDDAVIQEMYEAHC